jgi:pimeloyl-ACP methyl ester carboxylesterase
MNAPDSAAIKHAEVTLNGARFHVARAGTGPLVVVLHGFPECWYSWRHVMAELAPYCRVVAPDCRGYHQSEKTPGLENYTTEALCRDVLALLEHEGAQQCVLVGHDWGGVLAWRFAARHPDRVSRLVILNAPHPARFQWALDHDPGQRAASQYVTRLRAPGCEQRLGADGAAPLWHIAFAELEQRGLVTAQDKAVYLDGWRQPGALDAMLNWYRAAPFVVPALDEPYPPGAPRPDEPSIAAPTLLIWGMRDTVLLPVLLEGLKPHVPRLRVHKVPEAGHGIVHEEPQLVARLIHEFMNEGVAA